MPLCFGIKSLIPFGEFSGTRIFPGRRTDSEWASLKMMREHNEYPYLFLTFNLQDHQKIGRNTLWQLQYSRLFVRTISSPLPKQLIVFGAPPGGNFQFGQNSSSEWRVETIYSEATRHTQPKSFFVILNTRYDKKWRAKMAFKFTFF